jgi:hypothetical protein
LAPYSDTLQPASEPSPAAPDPRTELRTLLRRLDADIAFGVLTRAQAIEIAEATCSSPRRNETLAAFLARVWGDDEFAGAVTWH